jgi:predicted nicotinamide N-methyase
VHYITRTIDIGLGDWQITSIESQDDLLKDVSTDHDVEYFAYGLLLWPSAIGLARYLCENHQLVRGKRVLEIGCGVGLAGLAACALGGQVIQTDYHAESLTLAAQNADRNRITGIERIRADWREFPDIGPFDIVLGSDVLYERSMHETLRNMLPRLISPAGKVLLSDPMRPQSLDFVQSVESKGWLRESDSVLVDWEGSRQEIALFMVEPNALAK